MTMDLPPDLLNVPADELRGRVAHAKRVTDFDRKIAERFFKSFDLHWNPNSHLGQRIIGDVTRAVEAGVNPPFKDIIIDPNRDAEVNQKREHRFKFRHLIRNDPAEELYSTVKQIVRMTFPPCPGVNDNDFIRRRVSNCLIGLRNEQQALVRQFLAEVGGQ